MSSQVGPVHPSPMLPAGAPSGGRASAGDGAGSPASGASSGEASAQATAARQISDTTPERRDISASLPQWPNHCDNSRLARLGGNQEGGEREIVGQSRLKMNHAPFV